MNTLHYLIAGLRLVFGNLMNRIAIPSLVAGAALALVQPCAGLSVVFQATGSLAMARESHTATLLFNGQVLVAGGSELASAELYNPATGTWTVTGSLSQPRLRQSATLLPNGNVLVLSGSYDLKLAELYDPASGTWSNTASLATARSDPTTVLLPNGNVLVASGNGDATFVSAELYNVGLGFHTAAQPKIATATFVNPAHWVQVTGSLLQGISQASDGSTQDSSSNYPVVQLRAIGNGQVSFLFVDPRRGWSETSYSSLPPTGFVPGPALVTVFTNGIPSEAKYLVVPQ